MEKQIKRPFLFSGLVVSIIVNAFLCITAIMVMAGAGLANAFSTELPTEIVKIVLLVSGLIILALGVLGIVFASLSLKNVNIKPSVFAQKRGFIITTLVLDCIIVILEIIGMASGAFTVQDLMFTIVLAFAIGFIIYDLVNNNKLLQIELNEPAPMETENKFNEVTGKNVNPFIDNEVVKNDKKTVKKPTKNEQ